MGRTVVPSVSSTAVESGEHRWTCRTSSTRSSRWSAAPVADAHVGLVRWSTAPSCSRCSKRCARRCPAPRPGPGADRRPRADGRAGPPGGRADHRAAHAERGCLIVRHRGRPPLAGRGRPDPRRGPPGGRGGPRRGRRLRRLQARQLRGRPHQDPRLRRPRPREAPRHRPRPRRERLRGRGRPRAQPRPGDPAPRRRRLRRRQARRLRGRARQDPGRPSAAAARSCTAVSPRRPRRPRRRGPHRPALQRRRLPRRPLDLSGAPLRAAEQRRPAPRPAAQSEVPPQQPRYAQQDAYGYQQQTPTPYAATSSTRLRPAGPVRLPAAGADPYAYQIRRGSRLRPAGRYAPSSSPRTASPRSLPTLLQHRRTALDETSLFDTSMISAGAAAGRTNRAAGSEKGATRIGPRAKGPVSWLFGRVYVRDQRCPGSTEGRRTPELEDRKQEWP